MLKIKAREHYCKYDNMVYLAILMNLGLGLRVGELAALKIDDFDLKDDILTLRRSEQSTFKYEGTDICRSGSKIVGHLKKNRKDRHIPLSNYVVDIFIESLEYHQIHGIETDWLFVNKNGERLTTNSINQALNRISGKGNHTIRRTVITSLIRSGVFTQKEINEGRLFSAISYLCLFAIIPYLNDTTNRYIKFHAKQGMNLLILEMIVIVGHIFFGFGFIGGLFSLMEFILFAYTVVGFIFAITGNSKKLPYLDVISVIR